MEHCTLQELHIIFSKKKETPNYHVEGEDMI